MSDAMLVAEHFIMAAVICVSLVVLVVPLFLAARESDRPRQPADHDHQPLEGDRQSLVGDHQPQEGDHQLPDRDRQAEPAGGPRPPHGHHGGGTATA